MDSKPIKIDERMSRKIAGLGFVCACMVVGLHIHMDVAHMTTCVANFQYAIRRIFGMAVPLFFVFSGFLLAGHMGESGWWLRESRKRMRSLVIPYLFWNLFNMAFFMSIGSAADQRGIAFEGQSWMNFNGMDTILLAVGVYPLKHCSLANLWFLRSLIVFVVAAPVFSLFCRGRWFGFVSIAIMLSVCVLLPYSLPADLNFETRFLATSWSDGILSFGVGVFLRWNGDWLSSLVRRCGACLGWVLLIGGLTAPIVNVCYGVWAPVIVSAFMLMAGVWLVIPDMQLPKFLTSAAFPMYVTHGFVIFIFAIVTRVTGLRPLVQTSTLAYLVQVVLAISICVSVILLVRKLFPRVTQVIFGGR